VQLAGVLSFVKAELNAQNVSQPAVGRQCAREKISCFARVWAENNGRRFPMNEPASTFHFNCLHAHAARCRKPHNFNLPLVLGVRESPRSCVAQLCCPGVAPQRGGDAPHHSPSPCVEFDDRTHAMHTVCKWSAFWESCLYVYRFLRESVTRIWSRPYGADKLWPWTFLLILFLHTSCIVHNIVISLKP
jgi:hypothetical protein